MLQQSIKVMLNTTFPPGLPPDPRSLRFQVVDQMTLLRQAEAVTNTAREAMQRLCEQLGDLDFRPIMSEADYLMNTVAANIDNEKLSDADFREFIRTSINSPKEH